MQYILEKTTCRMKMEFDDSFYYENEPFMICFYGRFNLARVEAQIRKW